MVLGVDVVIFFIFSSVDFVMFGGVNWVTEIARLSETGRTLTVASNGRLRIMRRTLCLNKFK